MLITVVSIFIAVLAACGETNRDFEVEGTLKYTFSSTKPLKSGAVLDFTILNMHENERFSMYKCGPNCNTAKLVKDWSPQDEEINEQIKHTVSEDGEYYFWLQQTLVGGEVGPVLMKKNEIVANRFIVTFKTGTVVNIGLSNP